jgi:deoxyribonuclease-4
MIRFGPAGIGGVKDAPFVLSNYKEFKIKAAEIPFTYQIWIKNKNTGSKIGRLAKKAGVDLSIHAPYWINLNSKEKEKIEKSKKRILRCCEVASWIKAKKVIFHCGYYGGMDKEESFQNIKQRVLEMLQEIKKNNWNVKLCPETTGKLNVFGSIEEISRLVKETKCSFCIDLAHVLARYKTYDIDLLKNKFPQKQWHCHFSGIEYGEKGEKRHIRTSVKEIKRILKVLPKDKDITIINESPSPVEDSILSIRLYSK